MVSKKQQAVIDRLDASGFTWDQFRELFPFGEIALGEANYGRLVDKCLSLLTDKQHQSRLLDLLDAQGCVFLEQCWTQNEMTVGGAVPFGDHAHVASVWLQANDNLRGRYNLPRRDARGAMLELSASECLAERMVGHRRRP